MSISEKIGLDKKLWIAYSERISILFYIIFIVILWSLTKWFNFDILLISLPFGLSCVGVIWILIFVMVLVFKAKKIPIEYREYDYLKRLAILITVFTFIFLFLLNLTLPFIQSSLQEYYFDETFEGSNNTYIEKNVKSAVYVVDYTWKYSNGLREVIYEHKLAIFIINNGSKNIDRALQLNIDCSKNKKFIIAKPEGKTNVSHFYNTIKPWVSGDDYSIGIRWNDSYAGATLENNSHRWVVINCYTSDFLYCKEFDKLDFKVLIDDEFNIKITKIPCHVEPPSGNPKDWDISIILKDIDRYG